MQLGKDSASQLISTEFRAKINKAISQVPWSIAVPNTDVRECQKQWRFVNMGQADHCQNMRPDGHRNIHTYNFVNIHSQHTILLQHSDRRITISWNFRLMPKDGHTGYLNLVVTLNNGMVLTCVTYFFTWNLVWSARTSQTRILRKKESPVRATGCVLNKLRCDFIRHTYAPFGVEKQLVESDAGKMYLIIVSQMPKMCFREMLCTCSRL
jgi:hypothetical protein